MQSFDIKYSDDSFGLTQVVSKVFYKN